MKKLLLFYTVCLFCNNLFSQDCGGTVPGMDVSVVSTTCLHVNFYRPVEPEKYWPTKGVPQYENTFLVTFKPYFLQADTGMWTKNFDTTTIFMPFQITSNNQTYWFDNKDLNPGTSYVVCVYTKCQSDPKYLSGPLCYHGTTTLEAPCTLHLDTIEAHHYRIKFAWKPLTNVSYHVEKTIVEYRAKSEDWKVLSPEPSASYGQFDLTDLKDETYFVRVKFIYDNQTESAWSDILIF